MANPAPNDISLAFQEAVPKAFASLMTTYNFSLGQLDLWVIELTSPQCVLIIDRDQLSVGISIRPARADQVPKPRPGVPRAFSLHWIVGYLHPDVKLDNGYARTPEQLRSAIDRLAVYVQQYCGPMLEGDFSIWPKLVERLKSRSLS